MTRPLPNYIRMYRRRLHLSQRDLAVLLGGVTGSKVARHETGQRLPNLETALAYAAVFNADARELFAGVYEDQIALVVSQAEQLTALLQTVDGDDAVALKLSVLQGLIDSSEPHLVPWSPEND